jgi:guanine deaminase
MKKKPVNPGSGGGTFMNPFMEEAWAEAKRGILAGEGGPFGAVVVKGGQIIATGHNQVLKTSDPTAHAEIVAIRMASQISGSFDLSECELYTTSYPCPMCLGAILWAKLRIVYYGCNLEQVSAIGFSDQAYFDAVRKPENSSLVQLVQIDNEPCVSLFQEWQNQEGHRLY